MSYIPNCKCWNKKEDFNKIIDVKTGETKKTYSYYSKFKIFGYYTFEFLQGFWNFCPSCGEKSREATDGK